MPGVHGSGPAAPPQVFLRRLERAAEPLTTGLAPGKVVGDFRLLRLVGQGGMAQVWEAEQRSLGDRHVAVKFVRPERVTARTLELFAREARAGGRLNHPGIVATHGHGASEGLAWIALELVDGAWTLRDFLDEAARLPELPQGYDAHVARMVAEIADAMQVAHDAGVIHRDLTPQNVLVTSADRPKVTDFGLARITDESPLSRTGDFAGTYLYMSPEQVLGLRSGLDHRSDVFSLGVILYELLALRRPFQGDTPHQIAAQIATKDPPELRSIRSRIPRDLAVITGKAMEKDRDRRFASMAELAADLRRHLAHEPIRARPPGPFERVLKWIRRHPGPSATAAVGGLALAAISGLLWANLRANRELLGANLDLEQERANLAEANRSLEAKTAESEGRRLVAEREQARADRVAEDLLSLSARQELQELEGEAALLWPADEARIEPCEAWLERAARLVAELPAHQAKLAELRTRALPASAPAGSAREWHFAEPEDRWWHAQLAQLVDGLTAFADERTGLFSAGTSPEHGWGVERRLEFALALRDDFAGGAPARAWAEALPRIHAAYPGLALVPQVGLLPLGPDPDSGLWEFAHLATGTPPARDARGRLVLEDGSGLVLVLLPGGRSWMGAQRLDPALPNHDPMAEEVEGPVHAVELAPFFLAKHEMTQGQWLRFVGRNPSIYQPGSAPVGRPLSLRNPVELVGFEHGREVLARLGLELPTEAQWEYAARAGTQSPWWTGAEKESLDGAANLADAYCRQRGGPAGWLYEDWLDDGHAVHAPVGSFAPNPFGLHDVAGNVWEWCRDAFGRYDAPLRPGDGERLAPGATDHVTRGGGFALPAALARSAYRGRSSPEAYEYLGLRPARRITP
ncbi:MAG TPA: SUMF1/EgtB/PvdO family nonheme iron enzyme [Planctomycetota bacterium]